MYNENKTNKQLCYNCLLYKLEFEVEIIYIIGGIDLKNNKDNDLSNYLVIGMIIGLLVGVIFSIIMRDNIFFAISGTGFGISFGLLIADIIWCIKNQQNKYNKIK